MSGEEKKVWVSRLPGTYHLGRDSYGPSDGPIEIPERLAGIPGLVVIDAPEGSEAPAPAKTEDEWAAERASLLQDTANALTARDDAEKKSADLQSQVDTLTQDLEAARASFASDQDRADLASYRAGIGDLLPSGLNPNAVRSLTEGGYLGQKVIARTPDSELVKLNGVADGTIKALRAWSPFSGPAESPADPAPVQGGAPAAQEAPAQAPGDTAAQEPPAADQTPEA